ncbi:hypothetical protein ASE17_20550 [Phenylobacterium sp. Root77]|jgi:hypothetical protein|uniref:LPD7 domain-containing protein n=1 Tax=unclassified Phenylobacterium TaxID=2640670 RepID=UPI0006F3CC7E|nr:MULTISPECIES: LPD7 domain-containing protein [unclassified Phenylobacterium]KQW67032.1 hypothetical protein ASC73_18055 [Phenylobacterium sp. Root1277]KQW89725.1 hypothetical protein ASC79_18960 [Phenylobacterium sp. Root1290]KRC43586.1 hypothetical protein ASE17_20550 [Phenylobacterium sp. Root77]
MTSSLEAPANQPAETATPATIASSSKARSRKIGDVPDDLQKRYLTEPGPGGLAFFVDHRTKAPAFRDQGKRLTAERADAKTLRDMAAIARHRGWEEVTITGEPAFRRQAWMALKREGLETRGYQPSKRELQALNRSLEGRPASKPDRRNNENEIAAQPRLDLSANSQLALAKTVVDARIVDPNLREQTMTAARARIEAWIAKGVRFRTAVVSSIERTPDKTRSR